MPARLAWTAAYTVVAILTAAGTLAALVRWGGI